MALAITAESASLNNVFRFIDPTVRLQIRESEGSFVRGASVHYSDGILGEAASTAIIVFGYRRVKG